ncbi:MAG: mandelate racemase/muconate lactonizing enzyme family protein [Planctomycetes bacterium]|nr:mandelate racemase/muconate lactonizing enzyme family protein [Planctomycetota bacterium]
MKIVDIRACQPVCDSPPDWRTALGQILVAVDTDVGLVGYGVGGGGLAAIHIIRTVLRELLVGQTVEPIEIHWQAMYDATLPFGRKGVAIMALSGVDLALWDLRGKAANRSIAEVLGGPKLERLPTYATVWDDIPDSLLGQHSAFKLHLGKSDVSVESHAAQVKRVRDRVGPHVVLMVDAWMKWDVPFTLRFAERVASLGVAWIEEPLPPDDLAGYAELMRSCPIPIAGGEHEFTAAAFAELIDRRLHHVVQPDVTWCGGMTELVKIYRHADKQGVRVCPHRGGEIWTLPALAALDANPLAESGRPWLTWVGGQPTITDGLIDVPNRPGFGAVIKGY